MPTSHPILHYTTVNINTKIYANNIQDNHQDLYQDHIKIYAKITITIASITYSMTSNIYTNIEAHKLRSNMNPIHERHVSSQEKPRSMNHYGIFEVKNGPETKNCIIKINFIRTNRILDDDVNHKGKICKNKWREIEKTIFPYRIFH